MIADNRSKTLVGEAKYHETVFTIRGKDGGRAAWHIIRVKCHQRKALKSQRIGTNLDVNDFGDIIKYRDERGSVKNASGWGENPPKHLLSWLEDQFGT